MHFSGCVATPSTVKGDRPTAPSARESFAGLWTECGGKIPRQRSTLVPPRSVSGQEAEHKGISALAAYCVPVSRLSRARSPGNRESVNGAAEGGGRQEKREGKGIAARSLSQDRKRVPASLWSPDAARNAVLIPCVYRGRNEKIPLAALFEPLACGGAGGLRPGRIQRCT